MNVNMNISTTTTSKKLDIVNASSKTEQFKKVLDNHEFRFRNLTNENAQKKGNGYEKTTQGTEKAIAYGNAGINLKHSEDTTELKAEIIKFLEISIDAANRNPVNLDGELRLELISFIQTAVDSLKQTPENLSKDSGEKDGNNASVVQIQQLLQSLSSIFEAQQSVSETKGNESEFNSMDLEKILDEHLIGVENLTPEKKDKLKNNLSKIFKLESLQIQNVLQSLSSVFKTQQSALEPKNKVSKLEAVDLEKVIDDNLIGVENLTSDVKDSLIKKLTKIFELKDKPDANTDDPFPIRNALETLMNSSKDNRVLRSEIINFVQTVTNGLNSKSENQDSYLKPVDLEKMLETDSIALNPQIQQILQSLSLMFETHENNSKTVDLETNKYEPLQIQNVIENLNTEVSQVNGDLSLLSKDNINVQEVQIQQILQSLSSMFKTDHSVTMTENQQIDVSSINMEQLIGVENLAPETKNMLKRSFSEIFVLIEKLEKSGEAPSKIISVLQKLTTEVHIVKGDLGLLKIPNTQNVMINSEVKSIKDNHKSSFEEKFLGNLISGDKDEMKILKAVNFMNQFQDTNTLSTGKVETPNFVIDKNNFTVDIVKSMKFMETNNIKNLTVTMSPKELGEITIKLTVESGIMKAFISAQNKDTFNLLNSNMQDISDKLKNMDIKIQSLDINIYEDSTFFSKESNKKNNSQQQANDSKTNSVLEEKEDVIRSDNYAIEQSTVNKFV